MISAGHRPAAMTRRAELGEHMARSAHQRPSR
jgi:hypothetical protein